MRRRSAAKREQTKTEDLLNSLSHALALVAAFIGCPILILRAVQRGDTGFLVGVCVFSASIVFLYLGSTLYHALPKGKRKQVFRRIDHSAIFLLIAGSYTPFTLGVLRGPWGWSLFGVIWSLALTGIFLKWWLKKPHPIVTTSVYLTMGWVIVVAAQPLLERVPSPGVQLLIAGGLSYTFGVVFFAIDSRLHYSHLVWHFFVIAGTVLHYFAVLVCAG